MVSVNTLDLDLVVVFGTVVVTALLARWTQLPITALEILAGIGLVTFLGLTLPAGLSTTDSLLTFGSLLIVFLAGLETNLGFLRANFQRAFVMGLGGFLVPFVGLFGLLYYGIHAPLLVSVIGATALADTSISIVYTTLQQYDLTNLPFGRLILAATLSVNLVEDFTITTTTFLTTPGFLFTLGVLGALAAAAVLLPYLSKAINQRASKSAFTNISARTLFFSLAILALLSALVGVPGILFVFLLGLMFSQFVGEAFASNIRNIAFAIFVPLYFLAVGLKVDVGFVAANWILLLTIVGVASALKIASILVSARKYMGPERAGPVAVLMNTRLTSATVILTLTLALGIISDQWYSLFISVVVILALGSVSALRMFPSFRSPAAAQAFLRSDPAPSPDVEGAAGPAPLESS
ncbi:MAG: cation:proton antiporter [Thermoplasmata archaeon]|jgi:Kef-type K+ transport system membrane component KefB